MFQMPRKATTLFCMVLGQIDLGQILVTALVSAVVSFAVTVILRVWDRRTVEWLVAGEAHPTYFAGEKKDMVLNLELWNTGDADAYDVRLIRCNGVNPDTGKDVGVLGDIRGGVHQGRGACRFHDEAFFCVLGDLLGEGRVSSFTRVSARSTVFP